MSCVPSSMPLDPQLHRVSGFQPNLPSTLSPMTRIDFYVLDSDVPARRLDVVCKLTEKAATANERVLIHADDEGLLKMLDEKLWTFRANSFVGHDIVEGETGHDNCQHRGVQLSTGAPANDRSLLINLAMEVPHFFSRFERTLEIVDQTETVRDAGRARYRFYQSRGYPLKHYPLG